MTYVPLVGGGDIDIFQIIQLFLTPICTVFSFAFTVPLVLKRIVEEKQQGVKELMKMMGLPSWLYWVGWFSITTLTSVIIISISVTVIVVAEVFEKVNPLVLFISLFLYGFSTICFNFAQSTLFSNRKFDSLNVRFVMFLLITFQPIWLVLLALFSITGPCFLVLSSPPGTTTSPGVLPPRSQSRWFPTLACASAS